MLMPKKIKYDSIICSLTSLPILVSEEDALWESRFLEEEEKKQIKEKGSLF